MDGKSGLSAVGKKSMLTGILRGLKSLHLNEEKELARIGASFLAAGKQNLIDRALEENDRMAHLQIIETLLYGEPGIVRCPEDALVWAMAALKIKRKVQIAEYAEQLIPSVIAADKFLVKKGLHQTLVLANRGSAKAQCELARVLLEEGKRTRGDIHVSTSQDRNLHFYGSGSFYFNRAMDWYTSAEAAGDLNAHNEKIAVAVEMINRMTPATPKAPRSSVQPVKQRASDAAELRLASDRPEKKASSEPDFVTRRSIVFYTQRKHFTGGYVEVLGGLLPKRGTMPPDVEICFDGCFPQRSGFSGGRDRFKTDGNLQVFYRKPGAADKYIWIAKFVDTYNLF